MPLATFAEKEEVKATSWMPKTWPILVGSTACSLDSWIPTQFGRIKLITSLLLRCFGGWFVPIAFQERIFILRKTMPKTEQINIHYWRSWRWIEPLDRHFPEKKNPKHMTILNQLFGFRKNNSILVFYVWIVDWIFYNAFSVLHDKMNASLFIWLAWFNASVCLWGWVALLLCTWPNIECAIVIKFWSISC